MKHKVTLHYTLETYIMIDADSEEDARLQASKLLEDTDINKSNLVKQSFSVEQARDSIVFRKMNDGTIIGIFPDFIPDEDGNLPTYKRGGVHGIGDFDEIFNNSVEALEEDYTPLVAELEAAGQKVNVITSEQAQEELSDEGNESVTDTPYGKASLVYRDDGYGGYFEVYVKSQENTNIYDLLIGSINDNEDTDAMFAELTDLMKEFSSR